MVLTDEEREHLDWLAAEWKALGDTCELCQGLRAKGYSEGYIRLHAIELEAA